MIKENVSPNVRIPMTQHFLLWILSYYWTKQTITSGKQVCNRHTLFLEANTLIQGIIFEPLLHTREHWHTRWRRPLHSWVLQLPGSPLSPWLHGPFKSPPRPPPHLPPAYNLCCSLSVLERQQYLVILLPRREEEIDGSIFRDKHKRLFGRSLNC